MASPRCKNASTKFWKTLESKAFSEIFGLSRMWNNFLAEIVKYCSRRSQCEMKFAHIRVSEYFTFAEQIFHSEAISLARRANFVEKSTCLRKCFFLAGVAGFEPARCKSQSLVPYRLATPQYRSPQCSTKLIICQCFFEDFYSGAKWLNTIIPLYSPLCL